jgi:hypothetical protein
MNIIGRPYDYVNVIYHLNAPHKFFAGIPVRPVEEVDTNRNFCLCSIVVANVCPKFCGSMDVYIIF